VLYCNKEYWNAGIIDVSLISLIKTHINKKSRVKYMDNKINKLRMDKSFFSVESLSDQSNDKNYWFSRTPIERVQHIELLRRINYGHGATARLQRIFEVAKR